MNEYEIVIEEITPCGGSKHAIRSFAEAEAESPRAYVEENKRLPILEEIANDDGSILIRTGNEAGYKVNYTFTEI